MKTKYGYIYFRQTTMKGFWNCISNKGEITLGVVWYYEPWKEYVFSAENVDDIFSEDCLDDIVNFMKNLGKP